MAGFDKSDNCFTNLNVNFITKMNIVGKMWPIFFIFSDVTSNMFKNEYIHTLFRAQVSYARRTGSVFALIGGREDAAIPRWSIAYTRLLPKNPCFGGENKKIETSAARQIHEASATAVRDSEASKPAPAVVFDASHRPDSSRGGKLRIAEFS